MSRMATDLATTLAKFVKLLNALEIAALCLITLGLAACQSSSLKGNANNSQAASQEAQVKSQKAPVASQEASSTQPAQSSASQSIVAHAVTQSKTSTIQTTQANATQANAIQTNATQANAAQAGDPTLLPIRCPEDGDSVRVPKPLRGGFYRPLIVGHRGAPGYVPEETEESYRLAIKLGADYIEPDLEMSKDGVLIVRHENNLDDTTNAAEVFPNMIREKTVDGVKEKGVFTEDLTLAQIKQLKAKERLPYRSHKDDGKYDVITFEEYLKIVKEESKKVGHPIGMIPEIKHSTYFHNLGFDPEKSVVKLLNRYGYNRYNSPVIIQSMEISNLKRLRKMVKVELMQLLDDNPNESPADVVAAGGHLTYGQMATARGLRAIGRYADWVSPDRSYIIPLKSDSTAIPKPTMFVHNAHAAGLNVMPWTFRSDNPEIKTVYNGHPENEYVQFFALGIDGLFTDFADHAVNFRKLYLAKCEGIKMASAVETRGSSGRRLRRR